MMNRIALMALCALFLPTAGMAEPSGNQPIITDSRIKTLVYNENDVFSLMTHYGYQCNIEFGPKEEIQTISIGDRIGWQVVPSGRRLFIRAMAENAHTNMTVVTSKRAYQFDLKSSGSDSRPEEELVYVVRFFYPDEQSPLRQSLLTEEDLAQPVAQTAYNYNYTFVGPDQLAPTKVFDDGKSTFLKFAVAAPPAIALVKPDGQELPINARVADGYYVVPAVSKRFAIRVGSDIVCLFNEANTAR